MSRVSLDPEIEQRLVEAAKADPERFGELYRHYFPHIRRYFSVKLTSHDVVDDLTAQVFEKALTNIDKFKWQGFSFSAWLYQIAHHTLVDFFRAQAKRTGPNLDDTPENLLAADPNFEDQLQHEWQQSKMQELLAKLSPREQQVMRLKFYEGLTNQQIAMKLKLSSTNVGTILHRCVTKLTSLDVSA